MVWYMKLCWCRSERDNSESCTILGRRLLSPLVESKWILKSNKRYLHSYLLLDLFVSVLLPIPLNNVCQKGNLVFSYETLKVQCEIIRSTIPVENYFEDNSLYTLVNIIQSLYDGNTFVCVTYLYASIISSLATFWGHTGYVIKKIIRYYLCVNSRNNDKFD